MFSCFGDRDEWDRKEIGYIREVNKYKDLANKHKDEKDIIQQHFARECLAWQSKEAHYLEQIAELQNQLHRNEVVMQQYKISEGNFQLDRQQLHENQKQVDKYEKMVSMQQQQIKELKAENKKYLETILDLTRVAIGNEVQREKRRPEDLNGGNTPHVTDSIIV